MKSILTRRFQRNLDFNRKGTRLSPLLSSFGMVSSDFVAKSRISVGGTSELSSCADVNGFASRRIVSDSFKELLSLSSDESCLWNGLPSVEHSKQLGLPSFDEDVAEVALGKVLLQLHQSARLDLERNL